MDKPENEPAMNSQARNTSNFLPLASLPGESIMMKSIVAISAAVFALGSVTAFAADMMDPWSQMMVKPMTAAETAQLKAERDAAKGKWGTMTPEEKASAKRSMRDKKLADLNVMERIAQEDDMGTMTKDETAQLKADRQAAQAKYGQMGAEEKAAVRKAAQQKKLADLNMMERVGQENDMRRYMSY